MQLSTFINLARTYLKLDDPQNSTKYLEIALSKILQYPSSLKKAFELIKIGKLALRIQKYFPRGEIYAIFNNALQLAEKYNDFQTMSYAKGYLGQLYEQAKRYSEALQLTKQALFFAQNNQKQKNFELLYLWKWQQARILQAQQKMLSTLAEVNQSNKLANRV